MANMTKYKHLLERVPQFIEERNWALKVFGKKYTYLVRQNNFVNILNSSGVFSKEWRVAEKSGMDRLWAEAAAGYYTEVNAVTPETTGRKNRTFQALLSSTATYKQNSIKRWKMYLEQKYGSFAVWKELFGNKIGKSNVFDQNCNREIVVYFTYASKHR